MCAAQELIDFLKPFRDSSTVIMGIGNILKGDDAAGSLVCDVVGGSYAAILQTIRRRAEVIATSPGGKRYGSGSLDAVRALSAGIGVREWSAVFHGTGSSVGSGRRGSARRAQAGPVCRVVGSSEGLDKAMV